MQINESVPRIVDIEEKIQTDTRARVYAGACVHECDRTAFEDGSSETNWNDDDRTQWTRAECVVEDIVVETIKQTNEWNAGYSGNKPHMYNR